MTREPCEFGCFQRATLLVIGMAWIARAAQVWTDPEVALPGWALLHTLLPIEIRATLWLATGLVAIVAAWRRWEPLGYGALVLMPLERVVSYGWSSIMWAAPGPPPGNVAAVAWTGWWAWITLWVVLPAIWPLIAHRREQEGAWTPSSDS